MSLRRYYRRNFVNGNSDESFITWIETHLAEQEMVNRCCDEIPWRIATQEPGATHCGCMHCGNEWIEKGGKIVLVKIGSSWIKTGEGENENYE